MRAAMPFLAAACLGGNAARAAAPQTPGDYDFLCTVPGHATVMRGVLRVRRT